MCLFVANSLLWGEAADGPTVCRSLVEDAVVQPANAAFPEFNPLRLYAIATPVFGAVDLAIAVLRF
jgi:hypothetical protein